MASSQEQQGRESHRERLQSKEFIRTSPCYCGAGGILAYLHGATVNKQSVQVLGSLSCGVAFAEGEGSDASTSAVLVVGHHNPLHWTS